MDVVDLNSLGDSSPLNITFKDDFPSDKGGFPGGGRFGGGGVTLERGISESNGGGRDFQMPSGFGPGVELFVNNKKQNGFMPQSSTENDLGDLSTLDRKMDEIAGTNNGGAGSSGAGANGSSSNKSGGGIFGNLFGGWGSSGASNTIKSTKDVDRNTQPDPASYVRPAPRTWDGFTKTTDLPSAKVMYDSKQMSEKEKRIKKRSMLDELERWAEKGYIKDNFNFNRDTPYEDVEEEYDAVLDKIRRKQSIELQKQILHNVMNFVELSNAWVDPFGLKLDGLADKTTEELDQYETIFGELYDKWKGGKLPPELALLCKVGFSIAMLHASNNALSKTPIAYQNVISQSPELQRAWHESVVKTMSESSNNEGIGFITDILKNQMAEEELPDKRYSAPPASLDPRTLEPVSTPPMPNVVGKNMMFTSGIRPDLEAARGPGPQSNLFREKGVDIHQGFSSVNEPTSRQEMRGPRNNINDLLSGLKPNPPSVRPRPTPYIPPQPPRIPTPPPSTSHFNEQVYEDEVADTRSVGSQNSRVVGEFGGASLLESVISMEDATTLDGVSKRRRRKPRSDKNQNVAETTSVFNLEISDI